MPMTRLLKAVLFVLVTVSLSEAQDDEIENRLIGHYTREFERSYRSLDADIAFHWDKTPSDRSWSADWTGQILIRELTPYRFYAQSSGEVVVKIDGQVVLEAESAEATWSAGDEVKISPGFRSIEIHYEPVAGEANEFKLFWSNDQFAIEPVPAHLLFHESDDSRLAQVTVGEQLYDAHRCGNCHRDEESSVELFAAPALWGISKGTSHQWIVEKLLSQHSERMPQFGLSREQAEQIAAYLHRLEAPFDLMTAPSVKREKNSPTGEELFHTLGCLACHQLGELGTTAPHSGPSLTAIGKKRSKDWLATWLAAPERINPQHRMPVFKLSRSERSELVSYLASRGGDNETIFGPPNPRASSEKSDRGRELIVQFQCANCHKIPALDPAVNHPRSLKRDNLDWKNSCLSEQPDPEKQRPNFTKTDTAAIRAYVEQKLRNEPDEISEFETGERVLQRRQCLACHARGTEQGIKAIANEIAKAVPSLHGESQVLIPPSLAALGDKLLDNVLEQAISGKQDRIRSNWLKVRMPEFQHQPDELAALKHYFIEHDRMPPDAVTDVPEVELDSGALFLMGRKLIGAGGFSCIACHQVGDYVPKNTALGTRGSDLMGIGKRLRPEFYSRWTRAPLRVVPGMEMPSYTKPVQGVLDANVDLQLTTLWKALNDDRFEPPTNPTQVEQLWQVAHDSSPRIIRDVFTVASDNGGGAVARAFAFGFSNQHGVLFDLDQAAVREWRFGDLAYQRTEGKSWYWDMAGAQIATGFDTSTDLVLIKLADQAVVPLVTQDEDRLAHLIDYQTTSDGIQLRYDLRIVLDERDVTVPVVEKFQPFAEGVRFGWKRAVMPVSLPTGYQLGVVLQAGLEYQLGGSILPSEGDRVVESGELQVAIAQDGSANGGVVINYTATAQGVPNEYPELKPYPGTAEPVTTLPGYLGQRLPIPTSIMPTAMTFDSSKQLLVTSLKGHLYRISDTDEDGLEERAELVEEGLASAFGVAVDGTDLLVSHKPELLRLIDSDDDGKIDRREVVADGWGHTDNYHDWVTGPIRTEDGSFLLATGSDYSQPQRDLRYAKWRGAIVRAGTDGTVSRFANELRFPIGIAADAQGRVFVSDQQGVQNTFNEINLILPGASYGVPGRLDGEGSANPRRATIQIPHPWTRSVNGIFFLPSEAPSPFAGHGIGCEFNSKFLVRFTTEEVAGVLQGACYPFSHVTWENEANTFLGPICGLASETGEIYIGSLFDSGWLGGPNVGEIVKLTPDGDYGNGIREVRAVPGGFQIEFLSPVDPAKAVQKDFYSLSGYTRIWQGSYATDDSGRFSPEIDNAELGPDGKTVTLMTSQLKETYVYEFNIGDVGLDGESLFPSFAAYTLNKLPE